jgi:hypothetical protein
MRLTDEFDRMILAAVCDDFVTLEFIADKLFKPASGVHTKLDAGTVQSRLFSLISDKLINAYLLHADPPYITSIDIGHEGLATSWFYITQRGRKCLGNASRKSARVPRRGTGPDKGGYSSAVQF